MRQVLVTPNQVGEILRARRKARRLPQQTIAAQLGVGQSRLSTLEADPASLTLDRLLLLAQILGFELVLQDKASPTAKPRLEW